MSSRFTITILAALFSCVVPSLARGGMQPQPHLALQNQYTSHAVECWGVGNNAWSIQGQYLGAPRFTNGQNTTVEQFLAWTQSDVEDELESYLADINSGPSIILDPNTSDILVLDIEHPIHPKDWGKYYDEKGVVKFWNLMNGFKIRIAAAREIFPNAQLGLYGVVVPMSKGGTGGPWPSRLNGYESAGTLGVYDGLDYLIPVVYSRWSYENGEIFQAGIERMVSQAIDTAGSLLNSSGEETPVFPLTNFYIANGSSLYHGYKAEPAALSIIVSAIESELGTDGVYGFWNGVQGGDADNLPVQNLCNGGVACDPFSSWTIPCYLYGLYGSSTCLPSSCEN